MSFVIGSVTSNAVIIASDGRCCNLDGTVKTEHYNKTRKINSNTIIGYSGSTEACEFALEQLTNFNRREILVLFLNILSANNT